MRVGEGARPEVAMDALGGEALRGQALVVVEVVVAVPSEVVSPVEVVMDMAAVEAAVMAEVRPAAVT